MANVQDVVDLFFWTEYKQSRVYLICRCDVCGWFDSIEVTNLNTQERETAKRTLSKLHTDNKRPGCNVK